MPRRTLTEQLEAARREIERLQTGFQEERKTVRELGVRLDTSAGDLDDARVENSRLHHLVDTRDETIVQLAIRLGAHGDPAL